MAASESGRLRKESLDIQAKWALAEIGIRREKSQAERDAFWEKVYQTVTPGGLFNYNERIAQLERHFSLSFREALARSALARRGLKELYDYGPPFPAEGTAGYFDEVLAWVEKAHNRLAQISQMDQHYVLAISIKELAKSQWDAGRSSSQWTFDLPEELFQGQAHVRMRGLGLAVAGPTEATEPAPQKSKGAQKTEVVPPKLQGYWSASLSLPARAAVRYLSGGSGELDQKSLPVAYLGRVGDLDSSHEPEVVGINAAHNASPIGKQWKLTLSPKSTAGSQTASLQDVLLYLHVAAIGLKPES